MKKVVLVYLIFFCYSISSLAQVTAESTLFQMEPDEKGEKRLNSCLIVGDTTFMNYSNSIRSFAISGSIIQPSNNSFVRIILEDKNGAEYIVLETCRLYNDVDTLVLHDYCEETKYLSDISPRLLRIHSQNSLVHISQIAILSSDDDKTKTKSEYLIKQKDLQATNKYKQAQFIANNININNKTHHRIWRAEATNISLSSWEDRKRILGINEKCQPNGFEYYSSGVFELGEANQLSEISTRDISSYVDSFDWRNRHGINWLTSVKHQSTGNSCWAFAAVGVTEALVNLYYNRKIDYDLSEQEVISCSGCGSNAMGGYAGSALSWGTFHGISEEASFPFSNSDEPCSNKGSYSEHITMNGTSVVTNHTINNNDSVKKALIKYGPLTSGFMYNNGTYHGHAMVLVGYNILHEGDTIRYFSNYNQNPNNFDVIQSGDSRIGKTYWIFKNSYGTDFNFNHEGYSYVLFNDQSCFMVPYYAKTPISSLIYSDTDISITDNDCDGYYYWGIGQKPSHCPSWIPNEPDGNDHDYSMGPMDVYGNLYDLESHVNDLVYLSTDTEWIQKRYIYNNIIVPSGVILTIKNDVVFYNGAKISLRGGTLHIDGGHLYNANIDVDNSTASHVKLSNGGIINQASNTVFEIPLGTTFEMNQGTIE